MARQSILRSINEYLDAGKLLEWRREIGTGISEQLKRVERARRHLRRELANAGPEDASLIESAETLLDAEAANLRDADHHLQDHFVTRARQDVIERMRMATHGAEGSTATESAAAAGDDETVRPIALTARMLVAIDDSQASEWTVSVAAGLAQSLGAHVMLIHVVEPVPAEYAYGVDDLAEKRRRLGGSLLEKAQRALPSSIEVEHMLRTGAAAEEIVAAARLWEADLIVMGSRGRGKLAQLVLGSTAEAVIRGASCPVLTVGHEPARFLGQFKHSLDEKVFVES